ncbi:hypothetical protein D3C81_915160 [compost metagenome]
MRLLLLDGPALERNTILPAQQIEPHHHAHQHFGALRRLRATDQTTFRGRLKIAGQDAVGVCRSVAVNLGQILGLLRYRAQRLHQALMMLTAYKRRHRLDQRTQVSTELLTTRGDAPECLVDAERLAAHHRLQQRIAVGVACIQRHLGDARQARHLVHGERLRPLSEHQLPGSVENVAVLLVIGGASGFC